jgi:hypothetical protein
VVPAALLVAACTALTGDFSDVIAIRYTGPPSPRIEEGDTVRLTAQALGVDGQPLPDVTVVWRVVSANPDSVGIALDSVTGLITAVRPGAWQVQGMVEDLRTDPPIPVAVLPLADSVGPASLLQDTVALNEPESAQLAVAVYDLTTAPGEALPLIGKRVVFRLIEPAPGSAPAAAVALAIPGQTPGADPHTVDRLSGSQGLATFTAERVSGQTQPDSIIVEGQSLTARGDIVRGSPVRFVIFFLQS